MVLARNNRGHYRVESTILSHIFQAVSSHPQVGAWAALVFAIGFGGFAILLVEIKKKPES
ncbi:MAG: hypothetical protein PXY39_07975 [archaeon]|nr:hypothetical protein [archaeon]